MISISSLRRVHLIGIGGAGMSGVARLFAARGMVVSGSDPTPTPLTEALVEEGIAVDHVQDGRALDTTVELVVASAAISPDNAEHRLATNRGIPVIKYAEALGLLMRERVGIAVAGTHGKTSTASMIAHLLRTAGRRPSWLIGGDPVDLPANAGAGRGPYFVAEACEYDRSFLQLDPTIAVITNIDEDHLDIYGSIDAIRDTFAAFLAKVPPAGLVILNRDCPHSMAIRSAVRPGVDVLTFGTAPDADWHVLPLDVVGGRPRACITNPDGLQSVIHLTLPGFYNLANATAALAVGHHIGIAHDRLLDGARTYRGVARRFTRMGTVQPFDTPLVDDYAHHPTEIRATIAAARQAFPGRALWIAFQPHQAFRTRTFFDRFADALSAADRVILLDVYAARESQASPCNAELSAAMAAAIRAKGTEATHIPTIPEVVDHLHWGLEPGTALLTVGAGNVDEVAHQLLAYPHATRRIA